MHHLSPSQPTAPTQHAAAVTRALSVPLADGTAAWWTMPLPDAPYGIVHDETIGVTVVFERVGAVGTPQLHLTAYRDSDLPHAARQFSASAEREGRIADALRDLVSATTVFTGAPAAPR
jgi:hypothetical protein